ncbi:MAG: bifunctional diaminohydroxyphosphoribosylaminopyrimidine deaminase/5-amino-6-(5-phosphoribosylamino)uracil reductase RibD [Prevotella sp.]|nr:bifunctional diaminohydroxyphosphoribosylaminopyrimidine deaminase/5-amino-6-(5-phosphoribosylamino)uracil reductase RibD [Prevotella sp.]
MVTDDDIFLMEQAMRLAQQGEGRVNPNPLVGALIVKDDDIIARGWHHRYGDLHAERDAFKYAEEHGIDCQGSTMYVTLEPCCHQGHQPPCTEAIVGHGIRRVVVGLRDPNPLVGGKGIEQLRQAGIEVDVLEPEDDAAKTTSASVPSLVSGDTIAALVQQLRNQNRVFLKYITTSMPWVTAKWAMTLDGKIATATGDSKWITGEEARQYVHLVRRSHSAILCGIGTVLADDPLLNVRLTPETMDKMGIQEHEVRQPVRIVADRQARIPMESQLVRTAHEYPLVVAYADGADEEKLQQLREAGVTLWNCNTLLELTQRAAAEKIDSILLESGGTLSEALLREGLVDEVLAFVAPKIIGGKTAKTPVEGNGIDVMSEAVELTGRVVSTMGEDILISGLVQKSKS